jgi:hypothetical protein
MTWIDNNGDIRPQSWEEYIAMKKRSDLAPCNCAICVRIRRREMTHTLLRSAYNRERVRKGRTPKPDPLPRMRIRLFRADPHCFWCGSKVVLDAHNQPNLATVDHLYSRWHPERKSHHTDRSSDRVLHVMACLQCNGERAEAEMKCQPFTPKRKDRLSFAQQADATLARQASRTDEPDQRDLPAVQN